MLAIFTVFSGTVVPENEVEDSPFGKMIKVECKQDIADEYCKGIMQCAIDATNVECESKYIGCTDRIGHYEFEITKDDVYFVYTIEELAADMKKGQTAIKNALNELSKQGLLERVRAEFGRANHFYIKILKDVETVVKPPVIMSQKQPSVEHKSTPKKAGYPSANNYNKSNNYYTRLITELDYSFKEGESL